LVGAWTIYCYPVAVKPSLAKVGASTAMGRDDDGHKRQRSIGGDLEHYGSILSMIGEIMDDDAIRCAYVGP
jgi:hypothetical protein